MEPLEPQVEEQVAVAVGDAVIFQAADGSEVIALVQHDHGSDVLNLVYVGDRGRLVAPSSIGPVTEGANVGWRPLDVTIEVSGPIEQDGEPDAAFAGDGADKDGVAADEAAGDQSTTGDAPLVEGEPQTEPQVEPVEEPQPEPPSY